MIKPLIDRFDLIYAFKDNRDENALADYAYKNSEMEDRPTPDYSPHLAKHMMYAKSFPKPKFSEEARAMLNEYYVGIRKRYGSPRILETIYRIAQNIARLKLKKLADVKDAEETVKFYNVILHQRDMVVASPANLRDVVYDECLELLMESKSAVAFEELVSMACKRNKQIERYIGKSFRLEDNKKLRPVLDMLRNHSRVKGVQMRPIVLQYTHSDLNDLNDPHSDTHVKNLGSENHENTPKNITEVSESGSDRSFRSDRYTPGYVPGEDGNGESKEYFNLIQIEYLPNIGQFYTCKEHPDVWSPDLNGIIESHFKPSHTSNQ